MGIKGFLINGLLGLSFEILKFFKFENRWFRYRFSWDIFFNLIFNEIKGKSNVYIYDSMVWF